MLKLPCFLVLAKKIFKRVFTINGHGGHLGQSTGTMKNIKKGHDGPV